MSSALSLLGAAGTARAVPAAERAFLLAGDSIAGRPVPMLLLLAALSLLPFAVLMLTSFAKMSVVLSIARSAMGTSQIPPTTVLTGLAVVLSAHAMAPVGEQMYEQAKTAYRGSDDIEGLFQAAGRAALPLREFLLRQSHAEDRALFFDMARELRNGDPEGQVGESDALVIIPAFVVSELKEAFQIGFLVFLPFLILDMLVANVLMALGMQALSPSTVSLPFKLLLFVAVDGWSLLARGLVLGYR